MIGGTGVNLPISAAFFTLRALHVVARRHGAKSFVARTWQRVRYSRSSILIWVAIYDSMASHTMKTTIEIADDLFERAQRLAREEKTTFRALTEQGLRLVLENTPERKRKLPPLVTVRGQGLTNEYKTGSWDRIRHEIYQGRGA